jgi:biotin carboxyl carrier protein
MTFEIELGGQVRTVAVDAVGAAGPDGGAFRVTIDGEPVDVEARATELGLSLVFDDRRQLDVALVEQSGGQWLVQLPWVTVDAVVDGRRRRKGGAGAGVADGAHHVVAPMPGRVVRILVEPGQEVEARQGLVVVEAMKMENELRTPKAGTVKEISVSEGESVEAGRLLIVVE